MFFGISLGIIAAFVWSLTNLIDKFLVDKYSSETGLGGIFLTSCFFPVILVITSYLATGSSVFNISGTDILLLIISGVLMVSWIFFYLKALEIDDASVVMTLLVLAPIFSLIFAFLILAEKPSHYELLGGILMITGSLVITYVPETKKVKWTLLKYGFAAGMVTGLTHSIFKYATIEGDIWQSLFWRSLGMVSAGILVTIFVKSYRISFIKFLSRYRHIGISLNLANETLTLIGDTLFSIAILFAPIALTQTTEAYQPIFIFIMLLILSKFGFKSIAETYTKNELFKRIGGFILVLIGTMIFVLLH